VIKILDRYILQTFLVSLLIVLVAMMSLTLVLDLSINVNKIMNVVSSDTGGVGFWGATWNILRYYFYKSFSYFQLLLAPVLLISAAASMVRLARGRELTGLKAAGISLYRVMWPMVVMALLLNLFYVVNQEIIIPSIASELTRDPDEMDVRDKFSVDFLRDANNSVIYAPLYDPKGREMYSERRPVEGKDLFNEVKIRILLRDPNYNSMGTIEASRARWDTTGPIRGWHLEDGKKFPPASDPLGTTYQMGESVGEPIDFYATRTGPEEIERHHASDAYRYMAYDELKYLATDPLRSNRRQFQVAMHQHVTLPIMNLLILLLGLPFVAGREDRNYFISIGVAMVLFIAVFALMFASTAFGNSGHVSPLVAAWLPVVVALPASILSQEMLRT